MFFNIFVLFCVSIVTLWIIFRLKMSRIINELKCIPTAPSIPIFGISLALFRKNPEELFKILYKIFEKCWESATQGWLGPVCVVTVGRPEDIAIITTSPNCLEKHLVYNFFRVNTGLLAAPVKVWKPDRKLLNPTFNPRILQSFIPVFSECSKLLVSNLERELGKGEFNIHQHMNACTLEMICQTSLGYKMNIQKNQNTNYVSATHRYLELVNERFFKVWLYPEIFYRQTSAFKDLSQNLQLMHSTFTKIIKEKQIEYNEIPQSEKQKLVDEETGYKKPQTLLKELLHLNENNRFTEENIMDHLITLVVGATETSAVTTSFALLMLAIHPDIQERVYQEIQDNYIEDDPNYSYVSKLEYFDRVLKESQRLNQASPYVARVTSGDVKLSNCTIPAGVLVLVSLYHLHRNPNVWGKDADKFDPDHFLPENMAERHPASFAPFSYGPRNCIGLKYATISVKIMMVELIRNYKFSTTIRMDQFRYLFDISLRLKGGFPVQIEKRNIE